MSLIYPREITVNCMEKNYIDIAVFDGFHTTTVNGSGRSQQEDMELIGTEAGLKKNKVKTLISEISEMIKESKIG